MNKVMRSVKELISEYETAEPKDICEKMGIIILKTDLPNSVNGFTVKMKGITFIVLNDKLDRYALRFTMAHELGHIVLHEGMNSIDLSCNTSFYMSKYEREADCFAAYLLLNAEESCAENYESLTAQQVSQLTHIPKSKVDKAFF